MVYCANYNTSQHNSGRSFVEQSLGVLTTNTRHNIRSLNTRCSLKSNFRLKHHFLRVLVSKCRHPFEFSKWVLLSYNTCQVTPVGPVTRLLIQDQGILVLFPVWKRFSLLHSGQTGNDSHPVSYSVGSSGVKMARMWI